MLTRRLVIQYPSHVFKFSCDAGVPSFTKVADSPSKNAYILGVGHGTVTSLNGQIGTGLVWTSDVQGANLRIYKAVPENGLMTMINSFNFPNPLKFTRPVFGDGIAYMGTAAGALYAFGSPVNLPINFSSPYDFGVSNLKNATAARTITCLANIAVTVTNVSLSGGPNFVITGVPAVPLQVAAGSSFSFQATFNPQAVGPLSSDVLVATTNNVAGYSTSTPVGLRGTGHSNGLGFYRYTGCFKENNPGRQLKTQLYGNVNNTSPMCIAACAAAGYVFCGTQYNSECWGGPNIPIQAVDEGNCNYPCAGDINQICGGNGVGDGAGGSYISLFADSRGFNGNTSTTPPSGPFVNPGVGGYTSIGCYTEGTNGRALSQQLNPTTITVASCVSDCSASNYNYAGLEYGGEVS
jgi:hypothetical protein